MKKDLLVCDLGVIDYKEAWDLQLKTHKARNEKKIKDVFYLCEHPNTYTLGKVADKNNLLYTEKELHDKEISVFEIDRGGDITYHGPGQIVGYAILNLEDWKKDTHLYLRSLEQTIMNVCKDYNLVPSRNEKYTGVWIDNRKICAIGIKVSRWITMHGFAFNVNTDLSLFDGIIPCGIKEKEVTNLSRELNQSTVDLNKVKKELVESFTNVFDYDNYENISLIDLQKEFE